GFAAKFGRGLDMRGAGDSPQALLTSVQVRTEPSGAGFGKISAIQLETSLLVRLLDQLLMARGSQAGQHRRQGPAPGRREGDSDGRVCSKEIAAHALGRAKLGRGRTPRLG